MYQLYQTIRDVLTHKEFIPAVPVEEKKEEKRPVITGACRSHLRQNVCISRRRHRCCRRAERDAGIDQNTENLDVFRRLLVREESSYHTDSASAGSASTEDGSRMQEMSREVESIPAADTGPAKPVEQPDVHGADSGRQRSGGELLIHRRI